MRQFAYICVGIVAAALFTASLALAQHGISLPAPAHHPVPAPLVGVGLPLAGCVFAALALGRRLRRKA